MSDDVRTRILDEATALFARKGYGGTSVREVVDAAGVTKPTLYYYFDNKHSLFLEAVNARVERVERLAARTLAHPDGALAALRQFVSAYLREGRRDTDGLRLLLTCQHPARDDQPPVDLLTVQRHTLAGLSQLVRRGIDEGVFRADLDVEAATVALLGTCNLMVVGSLYGMPAPDDFEDRVLDILLHGVAS